MKAAVKRTVLPMLLALLCLAAAGCSTAEAPSAAPTYSQAVQSPAPSVAPTPTRAPDPSAQPSAEPTGDLPPETSDEPAPGPTSEPSPEPSPIPTTSTSTGSPASSGGTYLLRVNKSTNVVTAYTWDGSGAYTVPVRAMTCSTGGDYTPNGTYTLSRKFRWLALIHNVWGQYCSQIVGDILFHTVPAQWAGEEAVLTEEFNKLGTVASAGCVRLTAVDSYWIYKNCASGETRVEIGFFGEDGDPLGKPAVIKLSTNTTVNWDPYDINPDNPWNEKSPWLEGVHDITLGPDDEPDGFDWLAGIAGYDTCGNDWTDHVTWDLSAVDLDTPGEYPVVYALTDLLGRTVTETARVTVLPREEPPAETDPVETALPEEPPADLAPQPDGPSPDDPPPAPTEETDMIPIFMQTE